LSSLNLKSLIETENWHKASITKFIHFYQFKTDFSISERVHMSPKHAFSSILYFVCLIVFSGCLAFPNQAFSQQQDWMIVTIDENHTIIALIDKNISKLPNGNLLFWEKLVRRDTGYDIGLIEMNCVQKSSRTIQEATYNSLGQPVKFGKNLPWMFVVPETIGAKIYKTVCQGNLVPKPISVKKSKSKILLAEITVTAASLRETPNINGNVIREVSLKEQLILANEEPQGNWHKVVDKESQSEGWLHKTTFKVIKSASTKIKPKSSKVKKRS
jgi:hypothetical protein